jgi:hypothetical protein
MPNNQSIVLNQQSTPAAALVEKFTNAQDALLLRYCKAAGIDPRGSQAPETMADAVDKFLGAKADAFINPDNETKARSWKPHSLALSCYSRPTISSD